MTETREGVEFVDRGKTSREGISAYLMLCTIAELSMLWGCRAYVWDTFLISPKLLITHLPSIHPRLPLHLPAFVLPGEDIKERGFTRPRGAHYRHHLARQGRAGDRVKDDARVKRVGEGGEVQ